jgi:transposase-like protein/IS1 family transposase
MCGVLLGLLVWQVWHQQGRRLRQWWQTTEEGLPRQWHPACEQACAQCRSGVHVTFVRTARNVPPYAGCKSKRGAKKRLSSEGYACPCRACVYFGNTHAAEHALVGYGKLGADQHQRWRCQACGTTFSCRRGTLLYYLKSDPSQVELVLWFLAEGVDISVLVRYTGRREATLTRWLERSGQQSARWHNLLFAGLSLALVQMDELCVRMRGAAHRRWLWLAIDPLSKALPALHLGGRRAEDAQALVHEVKDRLAPDCIPAFTTDGLWAYFYALTAHFGRWVKPPQARTAHWQVDEQLLYGQLVKRRERRHVVFTTMRMRWGKRHALSAILQLHGLSACIQTAYIERLNLTLRQSVSLLTRKTWSLPHSDAQLLQHVLWWRHYYHFLRPHQALHQRTPAMALGLTDHVWSIHEFVTTPLIL